MDVIIVEDEKPAADNLVKLLKEIDNDIEVLARMSTIRDTVAWLNDNKADLIFLDIHLSDGLSFNIFEQVIVKTPVIFTTAYDQYAIKAFEVNSIDYLLKPIKHRDLERALAKYGELFKNKKFENTNFELLLETLNNQKSQYQHRLMIYAGQKIKSIQVEKIAFFYVIDKNVFIRTMDNENYAIDYSLDKLENLLDPKIFFRVNRQYMININAIKNMYPMSNRSIKIEVSPSAVEDIFVSIQRLSGFKEWLSR
jgi:two-component system, LytTR family, response regulator LytT